MNFKYIRVSTTEQNTARQEVDAAEYDEVLIDKVSGKDTNRPQLQRLLTKMRKGDTVTVDSYDRLARNTRDLLELIDTFNKEGITFISIKENIDTSTPQGKLMLTIFAGIAEFERTRILQRQAEGIAIAKQGGRYKGRQPIAIDDTTFKKEVEKWRQHKQTATEAMRKLNLKPNTFYRRVKMMEV